MGHGEDLRLNATFDIRPEYPQLVKSNVLSTSNIRVNCFEHCRFNWSYKRSVVNQLMS